MVKFILSITIQQPPATVYAFLSNKDRYFRKSKKGAVRRLEKTTPGPTCVGTRYREVVQVLPFVQKAFYSRITNLEPNRRLEEDWVGAGMRGHLTYTLEPTDKGTRLIQTQTLTPQNSLVLLSPLIRLSFGFALRWRLRKLKWRLERNRKKLPRSERRAKATA